MIQGGRPIGSVTRATWTRADLQQPPIPIQPWGRIYRTMLPAKGAAAAILHPPLPVHAAEAAAPPEELGQAVHLVVIAPAGKRPHLVQEILPPVGLRGDEKAAGFELGLLGNGPGPLVVFGADWLNFAEPLVAELTVERDPGAGILDQDQGRRPALHLSFGGSLDVRVVQPATEHLEQIPAVFSEAPSRADGEVAGRLRGHARIPALHHELEVLAGEGSIIGAEPLRAQQVTLATDGVLQVLGGEGGRS